MISLIVHHNPDVRDSFVRALSLERKVEEAGKTLYQHGKWLYIALDTPITPEVYASLLEDYNPDALYLPTFGQSIDMVHEEGDIILPNVFLSYNPLIEITNVMNPIVIHSSGRLTSSRATMSRRTTMWRTTVSLSVVLLSDDSQRIMMKLRMTNSWWHMRQMYTSRTLSENS